MSAGELYSNGHKESSISERITRVDYYTDKRLAEEAIVKERLGNTLINGTILRK